MTPASDQPTATERRIYRLSEVGPGFAGALLIGLLAYPGREEEDAAKRAALKISAQAYLERHPQPGPWVSVTSPFGGAALPVDLKTLEAGSKSLEKRLRRRIVFGRLALQPILALETGSSPLRTWGGSWNRAAAIRQAMDDGDISDARNFDRDYWKPSLPVAHLACAWVAMLLRHKGDLGAVPINRFPEDPRFLAAFLAESTRFEGLVEASDLHIPRSVLIRIEP